MTTRPLGLKNIDWPNLVIIPTLGVDNSCLIHSVLRAYDSKYDSGSIKEKIQAARKLRNVLARRLRETDPSTGDTYYSGLFNGRIFGISKEIPDYSLDRMEAELLGSGFLDHHLQELISNFLGVDIYFLSASSGDVFIDTREAYHLCYRGRDSIVIYHSGSHYEVVAKALTGEQVTVFSPEDPLIKYLNRRVTTKLSHL